ncbi:hypothetical protein Trydic_g2353 [Trypoxylus dichotomus]
MRVAFLFLPIFVCAGLVLASQGDNGQNREKGNDGNETHHWTNRRIYYDLPTGEVVTAPPDLRDAVEEIRTNIGLILRLVNCELHTHTKVIPVPDGANNGHNDFDNVRI